MHFVGEPVWLAPLNFPLHLVGELIKPVSLAIRLFCNMFGEEAVVIQLTLLALATAATSFLPLQLPMLLLGTFFSFLQALVFSTLLSIYISVMTSTATKERTNTRITRRTARLRPKCRSPKFEINGCNCGLTLDTFS
jgi:F0F1-type ATP synthase membrane subunit a